MAVCPSTANDIPLASVCCDYIVIALLATFHILPPTIDDTVKRATCPRNAIRQLEAQKSFKLGVKRVSVTSLTPEENHPWCCRDATGQVRLDLWGGSHEMAIAAALAGRH